MTTKKKPAAKAKKLSATAQVVANLAKVRQAHENTLASERKRVKAELNAAIKALDAAVEAYDLADDTVGDLYDAMAYLDDLAAENNIQN